MALNLLIEELNGTLIETRCDNEPCQKKIVQNLYEINQCGQEIDENTKYSQSAMIPNQCIAGGSYSVKHKCMKGKDDRKKVKSIYYSDQDCKKKVKTYISECDVTKLGYNKDTCTESGDDDQVGVISDNCCIRANI